jgi:hypothetical protein
MLGRPNNHAITQFKVDKRGSRRIIMGDLYNEWAVADSVLHDGSKISTPGYALLG